MIRCKFENGNEAQLRHVVVDALVVKDDKLMLVKRTASLAEGGKWALVGGYVERNESLAEAVAREVLEETGWEVKDIKMLRVVDSPRRSGEDRQNVSMVHSCVATRKVGEPDWESDEQEWYAWDSLPTAVSMAFDHAEIINYYRQSAAI